jgi:plastocyanin
MLATALASDSSSTVGQSIQTDDGDRAAAKSQVVLQLQMSAASSHGRTNRLPPAVMWLKPLGASVRPTSSEAQRSGYTLLQKNKMFSPHLLVVPVGSVVSFPNADPFFHNVFSLFDGKRFDLGLYEAGSAREVHFGREGVSYIFCNIHPEMSAVVLSLDTPFWAQSSPDGRFNLAHVPAGEYEMHVWVEGETAQTLERYARRLQVVSGTNNLGVLELPKTSESPSHTNEFGQPYTTSNPIYGPAVP